MRRRSPATTSRPPAPGGPSASTESPLTPAPKGSATATGEPPAPDAAPTIRSLFFSDHRRDFRATRRGERAIEAFREADRLDHRPREILADDEVYRMEAAKFREVGDHLLTPAAPVTIAHREAIPAHSIDRIETEMVIETLEKHPTTIAFGASERRTAALERLEALDAALDAAESARASNSIEKMLCHQMAVVHLSALRLLEQSRAEKLQPGEVVKLTNAAMRMMDIYQNACLVLQKLKTRGKQHVVVQYQQVNVNDGGQAVVAGKLGGRARPRGTRRTRR